MQGRKPTERRFPSQLLVSVGVFESKRILRTVNVGPYGLDLDGAPGPEAGQMVWLHIEIPTSKGKSKVEATAVVRPGIQGGPVPVDFSMFLRNTRRTWEAYIKYLEKKAGLTPDGLERRVYPRHEVAFLVRVGELGELNIENVSAGGLLVRTDLPLQLGTEVDVSLIHPVSLESLELAARVSRHELEEGQVVGLGLEFTDLDRKQRREVMRFVKGGSEEQA